MRLVVHARVTTFGLPDYREPQFQIRVNAAGPQSESSCFQKIVHGRGPQDALQPPELVSQ
jgi:hypothetical protein